MNIQLLDKNLDIFPQNPKIFSQVVMIILKSRLSFKLILGLAAFKWLFGPTYPVNGLVLLNCLVHIHTRIAVQKMNFLFKDFSKSSVVYGIVF